MEDVLFLNVRELSGPRARPQISIYLFHTHDCGWRAKSGIARGPAVQNARWVQRKMLWEELG
jgi:hypothetical protein